MDASLLGTEALEEAAVLSHAPLGDIHFRKHFVAADDRVMKRFGKLAHCFEEAIDSDLDKNDVLFGIDMDVGRASLEGDLHELIAESDNVSFLMFKLAFDAALA